MALSLFSSRVSEKLILLSQLLNHFDTALYGLLAPLLAPHFFPHHDPLAQLILAYSVIAVGFIARPLGNYIFGHLALSLSPEWGLRLSLPGIALSMMAFAGLPTYKTVGAFAPFLLGVARFALDFFVSGERTIASLYLFSSPSISSTRLAGWYEGASVVGILLASLAMWGVTLCPDSPEAWRLVFCGGALVGLLGFCTRLTLPLPVLLPSSLSFLNTPLHLWTNRRLILRMACLNSFSHLTYAVPFVFMNSYLPQITSLSLSQMMQGHTLFLVIDLLFLAGVTFILPSLNIQKTLRMTCLTFVVSFGLLFSMIKGSGFMYVMLTRLWLVFLGVLFTCVLRLWVPQVFHRKDGYLLSGLGSSLGSTTLGRNSPLFLLLFIQWTGHPSGACFYALLLSFLVFWATQDSFQVLKSRGSHTTS